MAKNEFLPFGYADGANVLSQADYLSLPSRRSGFSSGIARSAQINKAIRQSSVMASALGQYISDSTSSDVLDNGDVPSLVSKLTQAIRSSVSLKWSDITGKPSTLAGYGITDALARGDFGIGGNTAPSAAIDKIGLPGGFYSFAGDNTSFGKYVSLINVPYSSSTYSAQIGFQQGTSEPIVIVRSCLSDGNWTPTRQIWHSGNFNPGDYAKKATTLAGYGITDAVTQTAANNALNGKADKATTLAGYGITDALARGDFGVGTDVAPNASIDVIGLPGGFYSYGDGRTSFATYSCLINIPYGRNDYAAQIGFKQGTTEPTMLIRSVTDDKKWTQTREAWHNGNLDVVGNVFVHASQTLPRGSLLCDGSAVSRTTYARLFAVIGTKYGSGDGSTTFNLPDLRGEFIRGWSSGRDSVDVGRAFGSLQLDAVQAHGHTSLVSAIGLSGGTGEFLGQAGSAGTSRLTDRIVDVVGARTANETRPRNVALLICIRY